MSLKSVFIIKEARRGKPFQMDLWDDNPDNPGGYGVVSKEDPRYQVGSPSREDIEELQALQDSFVDQLQKRKPEFGQIPPGIKNSGGEEVTEDNVQLPDLNDPVSSVLTRSGGRTSNEEWVLGEFVDDAKEVIYINVTTMQAADDDLFGGFKNKKFVDYVWYWEPTMKTIEMAPEDAVMSMPIEM